MKVLSVIPVEFRYNKLNHQTEYIIKLLGNITMCGKTMFYFSVYDPKTEKINSIYVQAGTKLKIEDKIYTLTKKTHHFIAHNIAVLRSLDNLN